MLTTTCTLTIGQHLVTASVTTDSPQAKAAVTYSGDLELLPKRLTPLANSDLHQIFKNAARALGATLQVTESGVYDSWAE